VGEKIAPQRLVSFEIDARFREAICTLLATITFAERLLDSLVFRLLYFLIGNVHHAEIAPRIKGLVMESADHYRNFVLDTVTADMPESFWRRLAERTKFGYGEAFSAVAADPSLVDEQRAQTVPLPPGGLICNLVGVVLKGA